MKSNNAVMTRVVVFLFVLLVAVGGSLAWWFDSTRAVDAADSTPVSFRVNNGDGVRVIAANLAEDNLIRSSTAFFVLVKLMGIERSLQAGDFRLNRTMDSRTIARELTLGFKDVWVTTLEGWRNEEIAIALVKNLDLPESEFLRDAKEGYMFPDTYLIPQDATAGAIISIFTSAFDKKVTPEMRADIRASGLTLDQVVTLASIVEREGKTDEDRPVIAGILLNRLEAGWPLQADATLQYALGYQPQEKTWWKKALTDEDKKVRSPYNTYANTGLPPGPISNPGISAIRAAIYPKKTDYWFYIHDPSGGVHYATTLEEHNANIAKYLQ
ncbi:endolytic transglycosylase MltG, partial [Patescibacteria group bacterium]|nr:endolytic transglycosylase MltG [Patescibacteria group bacterium]